MTVTANRRPYTAESVQIVDEGGVITALWIADPEKAKDPEAVLNGADYWGDGVETVAQAIRYYKSRGDNFSGWIVNSGVDTSDRLNNKTEAVETLRHAIEGYFARWEA